MIRKIPSKSLVRMTIILSSVFGIVLLMGARQVADSHQPEKRLELGTADRNSLYAVTVAVKDPTQLQASQSILVSVQDARGAVAEKRLHAGDLDFYLTVRPRGSGPVTAVIKAQSDEKLPELTSAFEQIPGVASKSAVLAAM